MRKQSGKVYDFCEEYRTFLSKCKTERECVKEILKEAEAKGYRSLKEVRRSGEKLQAGDKVYVSIMGKTLALFHIGKEPMEKGMNILGAHIDSPRLDLKQNPLYESDGLAMLETHYYGGIKKYQWVAMPLALHGVVAKKDGTSVEIALGEDPSDPVIGISDLLPHLGKKQMEKRGNEVVEGEDLNILVGSIPLSGEEKEPVKRQILQLLKEKYNIEETDFISAELEAVPAGNARNYGLDESMIMGYGQDDRVCAYPSYRAMFELDKPQYTCVCLLVDKEEIGSVGATGMHSRFFENAVAEIMDAAGDYSELKVRRALQSSRMLSSDVSAAYDPNYPAVMEKKNSAFFGKGLTFNKFTGSRGKSGSNDANAEYIARIRKILDENEAAFQTAELGKVDEGGGGTIAYILANYGMEVIDCGVAVQNMHAPFEVTSKADIYEAFKGYLAFLEEMKKKYWDARHNCSAFVIGDRQEISRCSDDGEPAQTAGRPILDVLLKEEIHNVCVVVTRYFGGTLLGTGGLVRAYQKATQTGLENSVIIDKQIGRKLTIGTDYNGLGKLQYLIAKEELTMIDTVYTEKVELILMVPKEKEQSFEKEVIEATSGNADISWGDEVLYAMVEKKLKIFEKNA